MAGAPGCAVDSPYLVPCDGGFRVARSPTQPPDDGLGKPAREERLKALVEELSELQHVLYADDRRSLLLIFQAMDAAGKDSTIRAVLSGVDPSGCQVYSFKQPSREELDHDFLWRTACRLPQRGRIGVFNRSYYEEVLAVRAQPELLDAQRLPRRPPLKQLWEQRHESIRDHEKHLARNGTLVVKFWLHVSAEEQRKRFLSRLEEPEKHWKFEVGDLSARARWKDYMRAYQDTLNATARPWAPWYAIPADSKPQMRLIVADILVRTLKSLKLDYPRLSPERTAKLEQMRRELDRRQHPR